MAKKEEGLMEWVSTVFNFEYIICIVCSFLAYLPVYALVKFLLKKRKPKNLNSKILIMAIVGYITATIRYSILSFLSIDATAAWFISLYFGWNYLYAKTD